MKIRILHIILIFSLLEFTGCTKDELPEIPESNSPIFRIDGEINGEEFSIEAGEGGWLMEDETKEVNGVNIFSGILKNNENEISLSLYDGGVNINSSLYDQIINSDQLTLSPDYEKPLLNFSKNNFSNGQFIEFIKWKVNGDKIDGESLIIDEPGIYNVCANIKFYQGGSIKICNDYILGFKNNANFDLAVSDVYNDSVKVKIVSDYPYENISWRKKEQVISTEEEAILIKNGQIDDWSVAVDFSNGVKEKREFIFNFNIGDMGLYDFKYLTNDNLPVYDYTAKMNFNLDQGSFSLKQFSQDSSISLEEIKKYDSSGDKDIYLIKGSYEGEMQNNETEDFVDAKFNFTFALSINN